MSRPLQFTILSILLLFGTVAVAQSDSATISGRITDQTGEEITDAKVAVTSIQTGVAVSTLTNEDGIYVVGDLHPGPYQMTVEKQGFRKIVLKDLIVNVQDALGRNFTMQLGIVSESITIEAGGEENLSVAVNTIVDQRFVDNMPLNGRSFESLIELTPGVLVTPASESTPGMFSVAGQRTNTNYFTIDGVSANFGTLTGFGSAGQSYGGSTPALTTGGGTNGIVSVDAMQEFRIQTSSYAPEYGRSPGAQISIVTRGGTNQWHGTAFDYLRNDVFDARNFFDCAQANSGRYCPTALPKPPLRQNDFGGTFSGPIWKDHTFFFFSYEGLRLRRPQTVSGQYFFASDAKAAVAAAPNAGIWKPVIAATPTGTGPLKNLNCDNIAIPCLRELSAAYSNPSSIDSYSLRVDHKLTEKITLFARYNHAPSTESAFYPASDEQLIWMNTDTLTGGVTAAISNTLVNDFRGNWSRNKGGITNRSLSTYGAVAPPTSEVIPPQINIGNFSVFYNIRVPGSWASATWGTQSSAVQRQLNFVDTLSKTVGSHQLKFGVDYRHLKPSELAYAVLAIVPFSWDSILNGKVDLLLNLTADEITAHLNNLSFFGQDTWRATRRLTLTYGVRWDINTAPSSDTPGKPLYATNGIFNSNPVALVNRPLYGTDYAGIGPRVGAAYQVNPKTVLRGGFGLFYDLGYGAGAGDAIGGTFPYGRQSIYFGIPLDFSYQSPPNSGVYPYAPIPYPNLPQLTSDARITCVDPHLRLPVTYQWNAAIERELGAKQSITATYVGAYGHNLLFDQYLTNVLLPDGTTISGEAELNAGTSHYNALQLQFIRRMSQGLQALVSYSYSHSNDMASSEFGQLGMAQNLSGLKFPPLTPSDYDYRNRLSMAVSYNTPKTEWGGQVGKAVLNGWSLDGIYRLQSTPPIDVTIDEIDPVLGNIAVRPTRVSGQPIWIPDSSQPAGKALNPAAFILKPDGSSNDALRNSIRSPYGISQMDLALRRRFNLTEKVKLDFRAEYFNLFNHPMFGGNLGPNTYWGGCTSNTPASCTNPNSNFGILSPGSQSTLNVGLGGGASNNGGQSPQYAVGGPRSAQFTVRISF